MENYKVEECLVCGETTDMDDYDELYCSGCGAPLVNTCSNYNCKALLKSTAAYCKKCGSASIFLNAGIVKATIDNTGSDDIPF